MRTTRVLNLAAVVGLMSGACGQSKDPVTLLPAAADVAPAAAAKPVAAPARPAPPAPHVAPGPSTAGPSTSAVASLSAAQSSKGPAVVKPPEPDVLVAADEPDVVAEPDTPQVAVEDVPVDVRIDKKRVARKRAHRDKIQKRTVIHTLGSASDLAGDRWVDTVRDGAANTRLEDAFAAAGAGVATAKGDAVPGGVVSGGAKRVREVKVSVGIRTKVTGACGEAAPIKRVFNRRKGAMKYCYEKALKTDPTLKGKVTLSTMIATTGRAASVKIVGNTVGSTSLAECMQGKAKTWRFPPAIGGDCVAEAAFVLGH